MRQSRCLEENTNNKNNARKGGAGVDDRMRDQKRRWRRSSYFKTLVAQEDRRQWCKRNGVAYRYDDAHVSTKPARRAGTKDNHQPEREWREYHDDEPTAEFDGETMQIPMIYSDDEGRIPCQYISIASGQHPLEQQNKQQDDDMSRIYRATCLKTFL